MDKPTRGVATVFAGNIQEAIALKMRKNQSNPDMIILVSFNIQEYGTTDALPPDSDIWLRDANGNIVQSETGYMIDFLKPGAQRLWAQ